MVQKEEKPIGEVTHYYGKIGVAIVRFSKTVPQGTKVRFRGATTDFEQVIDSIELDHKKVSEAPKNKEVGIKVKEKVREGDKIFEA